jgi:hypothetical protein
MADIEINDLANFGVVRDGAEYMLPPEAWTYGLNVGFSEDAIRKLSGWASIFGTPSVAPHFLMPVMSQASVYWIYTSLTAAYVYDGSTHTVITRTSGGAYTPSNTRDWNGTILGGIPILNNGADAPQFWSPAYAVSNKLVNLTNWPASTTAKVIRAFGAFLVAYNVTKGGTVYPHMVKWSHSALPGAVPSSWDETDDTKDTGEEDLTDVNSGVIVDALPLGSNMMIYKENATWIQRFVGGRKIFSIDPLFTTSGILAPRCAATTHDGKYHFVVTQDDILVHNGQGEPLSILTVPDAEGRFRSNKKTLFGLIDSSNYRNSFVFCKPDTSEMWFCYPAAGSTNPTRALIWNYQRGLPGVVTEADGITFRNVAIGPTAVGGYTWATTPYTWTTASVPWEDLARRRTILCGTDDTKFFEMNPSYTQRNGADFSATAIREALGVLGRRRNGAWIEDFKQMKMHTRIWPKVSGGPINVRVGTQDTVDGPITWSAAQSFDPADEMWKDIIATGRALSFEFSSSENVDWRLEGYKFEQQLLGNF